MALSIRFRVGCFRKQIYGLVQLQRTNQGVFKTTFGNSTWPRRPKYEEWVELQIPSSRWGVSAVSGSHITHHAPKKRTTAGTPQMKVLEDHFSFQRSDFSGSMLVFWWIFVEKSEGWVCHLTCFSFLEVVLPILNEVVGDELKLLLTAQNIMWRAAFHWFLLEVWPAAEKMIDYYHKTTIQLLQCSAQ